VVPTPCYSLGYTTPFAAPSLLGALVTLNGTGDFDGCRAFTDALMLKGSICLTSPQPVFANGSVVGVAGAGAAAAVASSVSVGAGVAPVPPINANVSTCSINGVYQPPVVTTQAGAPNVTFVAFSAFTYVTEYLGLPTGWGTAISAAQLADATRALCAQPWAVLANATAPSAQPFVAGYCITGAYAVSLLATGYGLPLDAPALSVASSNSSISYALGSMLYEANALAWSFTPPACDSLVSRAAVYGLGAALAVATVIAIGAVACACSARRRAAAYDLPVALPTINPAVGATGYAHMAGGSPQLGVAGGAVQAWK
jgi:hypothetical protein